jgi:hypothetical protein
MGFHKTAQLFGTGVGDYSCVKPAYAFVLLLYSQYNKLFVNVLSAFCVFFLTTKNGFIYFHIAFYGVVFRTLHSFHDLAFKAPTGFLAQVQLSAKLG